MQEKNISFDIISLHFIRRPSHEKKTLFHIILLHFIRRPSPLLRKCCRKTEEIGILVWTIWTGLSNSRLCKTISEHPYRITLWLSRVSMEKLSEALPILMEMITEEDTEETDNSDTEVNDTEAEITVDTIWEPKRPMNLMKMSENSTIFTGTNRKRTWEIDPSLTKTMATTKISLQTKSVCWTIKAEPTIQDLHPTSVEVRTFLLVKNLLHLQDLKDSSISPITICWTLISMKNPAEIQARHTVPLISIWIDLCRQDENLIDTTEDQEENGTIPGERSKDIPRMMKTLIIENDTILLVLKRVMNLHTSKGTIRMVLLHLHHFRSRNNRKIQMISTFPFTTSTKREPLQVWTKVVF